MADMINVLNTIRDNASKDYQERIPEATRNNLEDIRFAMIDDDNIAIANEFTNALLNKVVKTILISKLFTNPLKSLKKGKKPLGDTVEEIYTNFIKAKSFDENGLEILNREKPDVKAVYHRMNRKDKYKQTFSQEELSKAFKSYEALDSFMNDIVQKMYSSAELDEFINMKQLIASAIEKKAMVVIDIEDPLASKQNGEDFIKALKTVSNLMTFPKTEFNAYLTAQDTDKLPITTLTKKEEQVIIIDTATDVSCSVDVLAHAFNMSQLEFNARKIVIDSFPDSNIHACILDEQFFQVFDDLFVFKRFENAEGLYDNYYLHVWQTHAFSILVNAVAFRVPEAEAEGTE